eukprot:g26348.t1
MDFPVIPIPCLEAQLLVRAPARAAGGLQNVHAWRVACGRYHTAVLSTGGAAFTFGDGLSGQLGRRPEEGSEGWKPTQVTAFPEGVQSSLLVQVACEQGQLCMGGCRSHRLPALVRQMHGVREVVAGGHWTLLRCGERKVFFAGRPTLREGHSEEEAVDHRLLRRCVADLQDGEQISADIPMLRIMLACAVILLEALVARFLELGNADQLLISGVRCFVQLSVLGFILAPIFELQSPRTSVLTTRVEHTGVFGREGHTNVVDFLPG